MNIILLSGGSGKRLWPLSNEVRSKQFLKIFKNQDGSRESMLQRMFRMIREADDHADITIATSESQVASIRSQLGDQVRISIEPCRRDTFPAIALAASYLHCKHGISRDSAVVVCPVDPYVETDYYRMLLKLSEQAEKGEANIVLMGIEPTYPCEKYGYILPESRDQTAAVKTFKEKPDASAAKEYIEQGALWNGGVFAFKLGYVLDISERILGTSDYDRLFNSYSSLPGSSFDCAVVEKEENIQVLRFAGKWKDLGTWNTMTEAMSDEVIGNAVTADCSNTHVINELRLPLIALGVEDLAIAATPDGILVADKKKTDRLKDYVADQRPMYETRIWGEYKVLEYRIHADGQNYLTKHLIISPGKYIAYQMHHNRSEIWTVVDGSGKLIIDGVIRAVGRGDTAYIRPETKHAVKADSELHIVEVQIGDELVEEDVERLEWDWESIE